MNTTGGPADAVPRFSMMAPSYLDIILPPFVMVVVMLIAIFGLRVASYQTKRRRQKMDQDCFQSFSQTFSSRILTGGGLDNSTPPPGFLSIADFRSIERYLHYPNSLLPLFRISLPSVMSLVFCPVTLFAAPMVIKAFWPPESFPERPNVNDAISCFLMPAGLVYAIAFGFSMQDAMEKYKSIFNEFREEMSCIHQMVRITSLLNMLSPTTKMNIMTTLKDVVVQTMEDFTSQNQQIQCQKHIWRIVDALQENTKEASHEGRLDGYFLDEMTSRILRLDAIMVNGGFIVHRKIDLMQWMFLEMLGFISFFGVILIQASSYVMELTICMLTVFSISLFCYILADFDDPFHGVFRMDVSSLADLVTLIHNHYRLFEEELFTVEHHPKLPRPQLTDQTTRVEKLK